jgi:hypothetical protein
VVVSWRKQHIGDSTEQGSVLLWAPQVHSRPIALNQQDQVAHIWKLGVERNPQRWLWPHISTRLTVLPEVTDPSLILSLSGRGLPPTSPSDLPWRQTPVLDSWIGTLTCFMQLWSSVYPGNCSWRLFLGPPTPGCLSENTMAILVSSGAISRSSQKKGNTGVRIELWGGGRSGKRLINGY